VRQFISKFLLMLLGIYSIGFAQNANIVTINPGFDNEIIVSIDPQIHLDYGIAYPLTYEFSIPQGSSDLHVYKRQARNDEWTQVVEKTADDFCNAIEMARFDHISNKAFVSVGFANSSDTTFVKITDDSGLNVPITFNQICKYYDNRDAVVSCSADDFADWNRANFLETIRNFRSKRLWLSIAVNTAACNQRSFDSLQVALDWGYMEASAHSRTHAMGPFADPDFEITGCKEDLIARLDMPPLFRNGDREYVYVWIAPYGYNDQAIESLLGQNQFLANRLYGDDQGFAGFPEWDDERGLYRPFGVTREVGPVTEGFIATADSTDLNNAFDEVVMQGGIYYLMCHPSIVEWDQAYTWSHLNHISDHNNIWYVSIGHLFVYHLAQENYQFNPTAVVENEPNAPAGFFLSQNYPNPFNPETVIRYQLPVSAYVDLSIYNSAGQKVATTVAERQPAGDYKVQWNASGLASGVYFYSLKTDAGLIQTRKLVLLK
jgi:hypothetical protein